MASKSVQSVKKMQTEQRVNERVAVASKRKLKDDGKMLATPFEQMLCIQVLYIRDVCPIYHTVEDMYAVYRLKSRQTNQTVFIYVLRIHIAILNYHSRTQ